MESTNESKKLAVTQVITVLGESNKFRPTSRRFTLFNLLRTGMTVKEFVDLYEFPKIAMEYLRWFVKSGYITVS